MASFNIMRGYMKVVYKNGDKYEGEMKDGERHGMGTAIFSDGRVYMGEWENDMQHGNGATVFAINGDAHEGEYKDGKMNGKGASKDKDGVYEGDFVDGKKHGEGTERKSNGDVYEGGWKAGKKHGKGKLAWGDGDAYEGEFCNDKIHGTGTLRCANGELYEGDWKDGKRHGKGKLTHDGEVYDGDWKDDKKHGKGTSSQPDGDLYIGEWKADKKHGKGKRRYVDGGVYDGEWKDDKRNGEGKRGYADGGVYEGSWKDGRRHGKGKLTSSGFVFEREWKNHEMHGSGTLKFANGKVYQGTFVDGKRQEGGWKAGDNTGDLADDVLVKMEQWRDADRLRLSMEASSTEPSNVDTEKDKKSQKDQHNYNGVLPNSPVLERVKNVWANDKTTGQQTFAAERVEAVLDSAVERRLAFVEWVSGKVIGRPDESDSVAEASSLMEFANQPDVGDNIAPTIEEEEVIEEEAGIAKLQQSEESVSAIMSSSETESLEDVKKEPKDWAGRRRAYVQWITGKVTGGMIKVTLLQKRQRIRCWSLLMSRT